MDLRLLRYLRDLEVVCWGDRSFVASLDPTRMLEVWSTQYTIIQ
jgi:hypothetical protein